MSLGRGMLTLVGIGVAAVIGYVVYQKIGEQCGSTCCDNPIYSIFYPQNCGGGGNGGNGELPICDPAHPEITPCRVVTPCMQNSQAIIDAAVPTVTQTVQRNTQQKSSAMYISIECPVNGGVARIKWNSRGTSFYTPIDLTPAEMCENDNSCWTNYNLTTPGCDVLSTLSCMGGHKVGVNYCSCY